MTAPAEWAANGMNAVSIVLAGRNSVHTWWTGIAGCALFAWAFFSARLYADVTLQAFFVGTSALGWWHWRSGGEGAELPVRNVSAGAALAMAISAATVAAGYGWILHRFTDAYAPFLDSVILAARQASSL